jgi:hypothetical protein
VVVVSSRAHGELLVELVKLLIAHGLQLILPVLVLHSLQVLVNSTLIYLEHGFDCLVLGPDQINLSLCDQQLQTSESSVFLDLQIV